MRCHKKESFCFKLGLAGRALLKADNQAVLGLHGPQTLATAIRQYEGLEQRCLNKPINMKQRLLLHSPCCSATRPGLLFRCCV